MPKKTASDYLFEELRLVQGVINRMGTNSFLIKGWAITLVVATLLIRGNTYQYFIAFLPWLMFWYLDSYFLRLERLYLKLFTWLRENRLKSREFLFDMDSQSLEKRFGKDVDCLGQTMFSKTLGIFYLLLFAIIVAAIFIGFFVK
jgi:hypothetical protein